MKAAVMQPYFLPYIGYFQLIGAVDVFVVYDNIKYTKKGWINRNRMLQNGRDVVFSLPLKGDSDFLEVRDRELAADFDRDRMLNQIRGAYGRAPHFAQTFPLVEEIVRHDERNLFRFLHNSIVRTCEHLGIATKIRISSDIAIDHGLKGQERVLALCDALGASTYLNAIGGTELYGKDEFRARGVELKFIKPKPFEYAQFGGAFVSWLSIVDVMMFNSPDTVRERIRSNYDLV
jgi:WbqC-like protein family